MNVLRWNRPKGSGAPNRFGDTSPVPIYTALGRAVSNWEGVEVAVVQLFRSLSIDQNCISDDSEIDKFQLLRTVHDRANAIRTKRDAFLMEYRSNRDYTKTFKVNFKAAIDSYIGWSSRRNELAHGYVTLARSPNYAESDAPIVDNFALCPSHARSDKWHHNEPLFNYIASDVELFADGFKDLDGSIVELAQLADLIAGRS